MNWKLGSCGGFWGNIRAQLSRIEFRRMLCATGVLPGIQASTLGSFLIKAFVAL